MFVGHAALAFALAALIANRLGWARDRALLVGVAAGLFAAAPDVDVLHAAVGVPGMLAATPGSLPSEFWTRSAPVHRAMTHSLVVAAPAAAAFGLWARSRGGRVVATAVVAGLVGVAVAASGLVGALVIAAFCAAGLAVATAASRHGLGWRATAAAALLGLASHPFGDLFTGEPPALLYPVDATLLSSRVAPFGDPTLDLLLAFGVELGAVWLAAVAAARLYDVRLRGLVAPRATAGAAYALAVPLLPAPTLDVSYHFVFSVLAVGTVGATPATAPLRRRLPSPARAATTGLAAVTMAGLAFTVAYLVA